MLIGLLSDTHVPDTGQHLPEVVRQVFQGVDLILHAGDIYARTVLDELEQIAPVLAARGDDDWIQDPRIKEAHLLSLGGLQVGLVHRFHDFYLYWNRLHEGVGRLFGGPVQVVVFGDTHTSLVRELDGVLLVNPGSATLPQYRHQLGSVGLLRIEGGKAQAQLVELASAHRPPG